MIQQKNAPGRNSLILSSLLLLGSFLLPATATYAAVMCGLADSTYIETNSGVSNDTNLDAKDNTGAIFDTVGDYLLLDLDPLFQLL